jgi:hypothetical protein
MVKIVAPFLLSALLFILVVVLVMQTEESFLILIFLGSAIFLAIAGVYLASESDKKKTEEKNEE